MTIIMNLEKFAKKDWYIEHFDGRPAFTEMTAAGFTSPLYNSKIPVYGFNLCYYGNGEGDWMSLLFDHQRIGSTIVREFQKNPKVIVGLYQKWLKNFSDLQEFYYWNFNIQLRGLSDKQLLAWTDEIYYFYRQVSMPGFIDGFMFYADKRLDFLLQEFCEKNKIKNYPQIYSILSAPIDPSFINEEEKDLHKIVLAMKGRKLDKNAELIKKHLFKYSWIKSSYAGYKKYEFGDLRNEMGRLKKYKPFNFNKNIQAKKKLFKKYGFTPEIRAISRLTEILVKWQDQRKIYTLTFVSLQNVIINEIARRQKIDSELLKFCTISDLKIALKKGFNIKELKRRWESCLFIYKDGKVKLIAVGKEAKEFLKKVSYVDIKDVKEIRGMVASVGKVTGIVKIIMSSKNINKIKSGDILVAPMTRPEHLQGMKKAGAIVTDDGGITSHAAIIARELKIPCIIGTKIATKVLKDGDTIEVDGDRGIVKILK